MIPSNQLQKIPNILDRLNFNEFQLADSLNDAVYKSVVIQNCKYRLPGSKYIETITLNADSNGECEFTFQGWYDMISDINIYGDSISSVVLSYQGIELERHNSGCLLKNFRGSNAYIKILNAFDRTMRVTVKCNADVTDSTSVCKVTIVFTCYHLINKIQCNLVELNRERIPFKTPMVCNDIDNYLIYYAGTAYLYCCNDTDDGMTTNDDMTNNDTSNNINDNVMTNNDNNTNEDGSSLNTTANITDH